MKQRHTIPDSSKAVRDVLGKPPSYIVRMGTVVIVLGFLALFILTAFISYHDIIQADIEVMPKNPPVTLAATQAGELRTIFVKQDDIVAQGAVIAELRNPADFTDVQRLKAWLSQDSPKALINLDSLARHFPNTLRLGELQGAYSTYYQSLLDRALYDSLGTLKSQKRMFGTQLRERYRLLGQQRTKMEHYKRELALSKKQFDRNTALLKKGVISKATYENSEVRYLRDQQELENLRSDMSETKITISETVSLIEGLTLSEMKDGGMVPEALKQHHRSLQNAILDYEEKYILRSPISGTVSMASVLGPFQKVLEGSILFTIFPEDQQGIIGHLSMPASKSGKVQIGQEVILKLDNYPFQQYGKLYGKVSSISRVPDKNQGTYAVFVQIPNLMTSYGQEIPMDRELLGTAEIVTERLSLMQRMLHGLRKLLDS